MVGPVFMPPQIVIGKARHSVVKLARLWGPSTCSARRSPTDTLENRRLSWRSCWICSMKACLRSSSSASSASVHSGSRASSKTFFSLASFTG